MQLIRGFHNLSARTHGCVLTVGNFDGVHLGHRAIIEQLAEMGSELAAPSMLLTFEPHPRELFSAKDAPPRLSRLREKLSVLATTPLQQVFCVRFDKAFSQLDPQHFIEQVLVRRLQIRAIVVGDDFRFGRAGAGNVERLRRAGEEFGFDVVKCATREHNGRRISSSWVREALAGGELDLAATLLGRPYTMEGHVAYGDQIGRTIGFPTANVVLRRLTMAPSGVFAVAVEGLGRASRPGVANAGTRPTVDGLQQRLEVHLLDFKGDIYGRRITLRFMRRLRPEQRFDSLDALKAQIGRDVDQARAFFSAGSI